MILAPNEPGERILLHLCCGPCGEYPLLKLREAGWEVTGYFHNPNIHPETEHDKREAAAREFARLHDLELVVESQPREELWRQFNSTSKLEHCRLCIYMRMNRVAAYAGNNGFRYFTTSLLVSPWQEHQLVLDAGQVTAERRHINFLAVDFRPGYREGQELAKRDGLYRQRYCGCIYSLKEADEKFRTPYLEEFGLELDDLPGRGA